MTPRGPRQTEFDSRPKGLPKLVWALLRSDKEREFASTHYLSLTIPQRTQFFNSIGLRRFEDWHPALTKELWYAQGGAREEREKSISQWSRMAEDARILDMLGWSVSMMYKEGRSLEEELGSCPLAATVGSTLYLANILPCFERDLRKGLYALFEGYEPLPPRAGQSQFFHLDACKNPAAQSSLPPLPQGAVYAAISFPTAYHAMAAKFSCTQSSWASWYGPILQASTSVPLEHPPTRTSLPTQVARSPASTHSKPARSPSLPAGQHSRKQPPHQPRGAQDHLVDFLLPYPPPPSFELAFPFPPLSTALGYAPFSASTTSHPYQQLLPSQTILQPKRQPLPSQSSCLLQFRKQLNPSPPPPPYRFPSPQTLRSGSQRVSSADDSGYFESFDEEEDMARDMWPREAGTAGDTASFKRHRSPGLVQPEPVSKKPKANCTTDPLLDSSSTIVFKNLDVGLIEHQALQDPYDPYVDGDGGSDDEDFVDAGFRTLPLPVQEDYLKERKRMIEEAGLSLLSV